MIGRKRVISISAALLFVSGFCSLVYQLSWFRVFRSIYGVSTPATAAVLAVFMGGLGLGAFLFGRYAENRKNLLQLYGVIELVTGLGAFASPFLADFAARIYFSSGGVVAMGDAKATALRLLLTVLALGPATIPMGGAFPAIAKAATLTGDANRRGAGLLYGANALGAMLGALISSFFLFELIGSSNSIYLAATINLAIGATALALARQQSAIIEEVADNNKVRKPSLNEPLHRSGHFYLVAAFLTGACFFLIEIVWRRMAAPLMGGTTHTFALILFWILGGIGTGGITYGIFGKKKSSPTLFALTLGLQSVLLLLPYALGDSFVLFVLKLQQLVGPSFPAQALSWSIICFVLVFPTSLVAGFQFPLLVSLKGSGRKGLSGDVGSIYALNTFGAICGALAGGFGLLPLLGARGCWVLAGVLLLALAPLIAGRDLLKQRSSSLIFFGQVLVVSALALTPGPSALWRHSSIGMGIFQLEDDSFNGRREFITRMSRGVINEWEGVESSIAARIDDGLALIINGKSDGNAVGDASGFINIGLFGALLHPEPASALVIGLASGISAGWLAEVPSIKKVDIAELEPSIIDFAEMSVAANFDVLHNPKCRTFIVDGREFLQTTSNRYDLIVSQPSNPYREGVASLYSREFYQASQKQLNSNGIFIQWIQTYDMDEKSFHAALSTIAGVYKYVGIWNTFASGDLLLVASDARPIINSAEIEKRLQDYPYKKGLGKIGGINSIEIFLGAHLANFNYAGLKEVKELSAGKINSDDHLILEFWLAKIFGKQQSISVNDILQRAASNSVRRPYLEDDATAIDWEKVDYFAENNFERYYTDSLKEAAKTATEYYAGDEANDKLLETLDASSGGDLSLSMQAALSMAGGGRLSDSGISSLEAELDKLDQGGYRSEVSIIRLLLALRTGRLRQIRLPAEAIDQLRNNPFIFKPAAGALLGIISDRRFPQELLPETYRLLAASPFALYNLEFRRQQVMLVISTSILATSGDDTTCRDYFDRRQWPEWSADYLKAAENCYRRRGGEKHKAAENNLSLFLRNQ